MELSNEKGAKVASGELVNTQRLKRFKLKARRDVLTLASNSKDDRLLQKTLLFLANAPAELLHKLSRQLRALLQKLRARIQRGVWRLPRFLTGDVIRFEDALGRRSNLPFGYFRHWVFLQRFLIHIFHGVPGFYQVLRGRYRLALNRTGQFISESQWSQFAQPGDEVTMSILSSTPSGLDRTLKCPTCNMLSAEDNSDSGRIKCTYCDTIYRVVSAPHHPYIKASDGRYIPPPVSIQRRIENARTQNAGSAEETRFDSRGNEEIASSIDSLDTTARTNLGMSKLKHVLVQTTPNPDEIVDAIEDLIDQKITMSNDSAMTTHPDVLRLRAANELIRQERRRRGELNYLDFKEEHKSFMEHSRAVVRDFQAQIHNAHHHTDIPANRRQYLITSYCNWVRSHYSLISDPFSIGFSGNGNGNGSSDSLTTDDDSALILVLGLVGEHSCFRLPRSLTIGHLKEAYSTRRGNPVQQQYLVYRGRRLEDHLTIGHYRLGPEYYVHMLLPIWRDTFYDKRK